MRDHFEVDIPFLNSVHSSDEWLTVASFLWCSVSLLIRTKSCDIVCRRYSLHSVTRVVKKEDKRKGARYFIEAIITDLLSGKKYNLAEYVFQPKGNNLPMCYPQGMQWNKTADVYLILTAKNLGRWVHHFIKNMEKIAQETNDEHLHVIIYDFDSGDIDIKDAFQRTILKNYHYITKPGNYSRARSFKEAIESVKNPDSIVVTIDMHLDIGSQFINEIRKVSYLLYMYILKSMKKKAFLFSAFTLRVSPLLRLSRHSKVCLLTYYVTDVILITIIMALVIQSARERLT